MGSGRGIPNLTEGGCFQLGKTEIEAKKSDCTAASNHAARGWAKKKERLIKFDKCGRKQLEVPGMHRSGSLTIGMNMPSLALHFLRFERVRFVLFYRTCHRRDSSISHVLISFAIPINCLGGISTSTLPLAMAMGGAERMAACAMGSRMAVMPALA
eukprot:754994-Hanusia_phi.AAC.16